MKIAHKAQHGSHYMRRIMLIATLYVRNTFNSFGWADMVDAPERIFRILDYLLHITKNHLSLWEFYSISDGPHRREVTSRLPRSDLWSRLWNTSYDGILQIKMLDNTFLVGIQTTLLCHCHCCLKYRRNSVEMEPSHSTG